MERWTDFIDDRVDFEIALRQLWCILNEENICILMLVCSGWKIGDIGAEYDLTSRQIGNKVDRLRRRMMERWALIEAQHELS